MNNETWADDLDAVYIADRNLLLRVPNVKRYRIAEGCERVDAKAFDECQELECLYLPYTLSEDAVEETLNYMPNTVGNFCVWDRPYVDEVLDVNEYWYDEDEAETDEYGVIYANEGKRLIAATKPDMIGKDYYVQDGVLTICDGVFGSCDYVVLSVPRSIKSIGDYIFGNEGGRIEIRDL